MKQNLFVKQLLVVLLAIVGIVPMWGADQTITITYFDVTQTSYSASEKSFTSGVEFGYINMMKNNANGTPSGWAASQVIQCKTASSLRNTTEISGLKNIRVYLAANTNAFTIYTSSSEITSTPGSGGTVRPTTATGTKSQSYTTYVNKKTGSGTATLNYYDFPVTSGDNYFYLVVGSSTIYIWSIELTYDPSSGSTKTLN